MKHIGIFLLFLLNNFLFSQTITIKTDSYQHVFEGGGVSFGLYNGHHWSMNVANREKALQWINRDCNMAYLQDYVSTSLFPPLDADYFDRRSNYVNEAKRYRPDLKFIITTNRFPQNLTQNITVNGVVETVLRSGDADIYDRVAQYYFTVLKGFHDRGVEVDILNVVNEPDWDKKYYFGHGSNTEFAVAQLFFQAVPKLKEILRDSVKNPQRIKIPKIMGPSTLSPTECMRFLRYFKLNFPVAWQQIDIVACHQYNGGTDEITLNAISQEAENKPVMQSEMHTNRGDNLGTLPIGDPLRGCLSLAATFGAAVRNGFSAWIYFQTNYPEAYTPAGLISVPWATTDPVPYKHYYVYRQLTSAQPPKSHVIRREIFNFGGAEVIAFRQRDKDTVFVHVTNYGNASRSVSLITEGYKIKSVQQRVTDANADDAYRTVQNFATPVAQFPATVTAYSVNTFKITVQKEPVATRETAAEIPIRLIQIEGQILIQTIDNQFIENVMASNLAGQTVFNSKLLRGVSEAKMEVSSWANGLYFLSIKTEKGQAVKRVVVVK
jgi:O-glycosyl hydrolase